MGTTFRTKFIKFSGDVRALIGASKELVDRYGLRPFHVYLKDSLTPLSQQVLQTDAQLVQSLLGYTLCTGVVSHPGEFRDFRGGRHDT